jgi:hypothetical protein
MALSDTASESSWQPAKDTHISLPLPLAFKIYCSKSRLTHSEFYIGHEKGQKLHAISGGYKGWFKATIGLHEGSTVNTPILGGAVIDSKKTIEITLPSSGKHTLQADSTLSSDFAFDFAIPGSSTPEHFEWRRSKGPEVASLEGRGKGGWVLLRVGHGLDASAGEPVAAYSVDLTSLKLSGHFAFFGSGRTGELGADFAVLAVVSALSLGQKKRDSMYSLVAVTSAVAAA